MTAREIQHYRIDAELGKGSAGIVYRAYDERLMRPVVLKMLHGSGDPQALTKLLREARIASSIDHPNVCAIYEVGESAEGPYIVMQYVKGRTLQQLISEGPLDIFFALSVGVQVAEGLNAAHELGILHRDLKPANVMVTDTGLAKILDFGLATKRAWTEEITQTPATHSPTSSFASSQNLGTTAYMAPELFVTLKSTEKTDIFALGTMLYESLTGRHPFWTAGIDQVQLEQAIQFREPSGIAALRGELGADLNAVIRRAMAKNPAQRFETAGELRNALKQAARALRADAYGDTDDDDDRASIAPRDTSAPSKQRSRNLIASVADRLFGPSSRPLPANVLVVAPFRMLTGEDKRRGWGRALADALGARLTDIDGLQVKATRALSLELKRADDPFAAARKLGCGHIVVGSYALMQEGVSVTWQLLSVENQQVRTGETLFVNSQVLRDVEDEVVESAYANLSVNEVLLRPQNGLPDALVTPPSDTYLQARALLTSFAVKANDPEQLREARELLERCTEAEPESALAHSALGIAHYYAVRVGFEGAESLRAGQAALERAVQLDAGLIEAQVYLTHTLLWRGHKRDVRNGVQNLIFRAPRDADAHALAGLVLSLDGLYEESLAAFSRSLTLNPADAASLFNHRSRVYQYLGRFDLARTEVTRGLRLEPAHSLLLASLAYLDFREGDAEGAVARFEKVIERNPYLRVANANFAICLAQMGRTEDAAGQMNADVRRVAEADCEMAYRVASYYAVLGDKRAALDWLRRSIYLGNENYPWLARNRAWDGLRREPAFQELILDLKEAFRANETQWRRLFARGRRPRQPSAAPPPRP